MRTIEISRHETERYVTTEYAEVFDDGNVVLHERFRNMVTGDEVADLMSELTIQQLKALAAAL